MIMILFFLKNIIIIFDKNFLTILSDSISGPSSPAYYSNTSMSFTSFWISFLNWIFL